MRTFYVTSKKALLRLRRDLWALPREKPAIAENAVIAVPPSSVTRRCRDDDAVGATRRAKETMDRNHLI